VRPKTILKAATMLQFPVLYILTINL